jgi:hypothetical protein
VGTPTKACTPGGREAAHDVSNDMKRGKLMLPETVSKRLETLGEVSRQGKRVNGLFRLLESPTMYLKAYANIYANKGATTKGIDGATMDGFSEDRVLNLIELLRAPIHPETCTTSICPSHRKLHLLSPRKSPWLKGE